MIEHFRENDKRTEQFDTLAVNLLQREVQDSIRLHGWKPLESTGSNAGLPNLQLTDLNDQRQSHARESEKHAQIGSDNSLENSKGEHSSLDTVKPLEKWTYGSRLMELGENTNHDDPTQKDAMIKRFEDLKNGPPPTKYIGMEFLPRDWEKNLEYRKSDPEKYKEARKEFVDLMTKAMTPHAPDWAPPEKKDQANSPKEAAKARQAAEKYMQMIEKADDVGLKVVGLEPKTDLRSLMDSMEKYLSDPKNSKVGDQKALDLLKNFAKTDVKENSPEYARLHNYVRSKLGDKAGDDFMKDLQMLKDKNATGKTFNFDALGSTATEALQKFGNLIQMDWRNDSWAKVIDNLLKHDDHTRMAVYGGFAHFKDLDGQHNSINHLLPSRYSPDYVELK